MNEQLKKIMIVDDSDIDREILRNILESDYEVLEETNGFSALEHILSKKINVDAIMLDISMPIVDGFAVLEILKSNNIRNIPVIMITSEATKENVFKAVQFGVFEFISKPFEPDFILNRLRILFNLPEVQKKVLTPEEAEEENHDILSGRDVEKTNEYFDRLKNLFTDFLRNRAIDASHYVRVESLMNVLVKYYAAENPRKKLTSDHVKIIAKAAYLHDIGMITLPNECLSLETCTGTDIEIYHDHTSTGAKIVRLNTSPAVQFFVDACSEICMHHHERYDGTGFPHQLCGKDNSVFASLCAIAADFDKVFYNRNIFDEQQFDFIVSEMTLVKSRYDPDILDLFLKCKTAIIAVYRKTDVYVRH